MSAARLVAMSSLIGKRLQGGKYKLEAVLGRGGFGLTFRAHQTYLDQVVVIKTLHESHWRSPNLSDLQGQFQDEARRLAMCSHPNVVRVSDFFIEDDLPYMVMDYIPGRSLADIVLPSNPLPVKASVDYISQIGLALQAVHAKGLLHRDVKPQNIMIHELTGEAILIDFGIARELTQNSTQTHTSIVSEGYAPIEQYLPKAHRSAATDVYGLAATLYTLLTAEVPVAAVLRDRNPLTPIRQLRPDVKEPMALAIDQGMNIELPGRPQSVGRWLTMLTEGQKTGRKSGLLGRSQKPTNGAASSPVLSPSEVPTRVAAPAYSSRTAAKYGTEERTVAVPIPTGYREETAYRPSSQPSYQPQAQKKGLGCLSVLGLMTVLVAGVFAGGGYWLYRNVSEGLSNIPEISLPDELKLPTSTDNEEDAAETDSDKKEKVAEKEKKEEISDAEERDVIDEQPTITEPEYAPLPETPSANDSRPPLVLTNSGSSTDARASNPGKTPTVPGFSPGSSEDEIRAALGAPTDERSGNGFYTSTYTLVPNRVTLAYTYENGSDRVRQSEAAFAPGIDRFIVRTALVSMLDGRSTREIENGLKALRKGDRDRVEIDTNQFVGAIERNANDYVHIYIRARE